MDVRVGDKLQMKKPHPCGTNVFEVLRIGALHRLRQRSHGAPPQV